MGRNYRSSSRRVKEALKASMLFQKVPSFPIHLLREIYKDVLETIAFKYKFYLNSVFNTNELQNSSALLFVKFIIQLHID